MKDFTGIIVVVPTPFDADGRIDDASVESLIGHYLDLGVQGLTIMGVMGEGSKLTATESQTLMRRIFSVVITTPGRTPSSITMFAPPPRMRGTIPRSRVAW